MQLVIESRSIDRSTPSPVLGHPPTVRPSTALTTTNSSLSSILTAASLFIRSMSASRRRNVLTYTALEVSAGKAGAPSTLVLSLCATGVPLLSSSVTFVDRAAADHFIHQLPWYFTCHIRPSDLATVAPGASRALSLPNAISTTTVALPPSSGAAVGLSDPALSAGTPVLLVHSINWCGVSLLTASVLGSALLLLHTVRRWPRTT